MPPPPRPPRRSPAPAPPAAEDAARCCSPADCSHRVMTASPLSPAADDAAAAALGPLLRRQLGVRRRRANPGGGARRRGGSGIWRPDLRMPAGRPADNADRIWGANRFEISRGGRGRVGSNWGRGIRGSEEDWIGGEFGMEVVLKWISESERRSSVGGVDDAETSLKTHARERER
uniref:ATP binding protein n=1 Tax=Arundo donax TaxID=35708 RepID=A0A0A9EW84_ARUDO